MKKYLVALVVLCLFGMSFSLKNTMKPSILERIANANGFENWKNVREIKFTFNVDRDTTHFERKWTWNPKTNDITSESAKGTIRYSWSNMDSIAYKTNSGFINDKYWLLVPFQLVWDASNISYEHFEKAEAPISKKLTQKLTIVYGNEGGYTPGDAYDFFFNDDLIIQEWVFRKSNQVAPSLITTFEEYKTINGIHIATMHKKDEGNFKLYFTDIDIKSNKN